MGELSQDLQDVLEKFKAFLREQHKEESTVKIYTAEVRHFLSWMESEHKVLSQITEDDILHSRDVMYNMGMKYATINKSISILSSFFKWARHQALINFNPAEDTRLLDPKTKDLPRGLTKEQELLLLKCAAKERNDFKRTRNEALIDVMLRVGLRVEEVTHLRLDSLKEKELIVYNDDQPTRKVPIDEQTKRKLEAWIGIRSKANKPEYRDSPYMFVTERTGHMQPRSIQFVVEGLSEDLGFPLWCQTLRHTYCYRLAQSGIPLEQLKQWAGHKSILTTYQYFRQEGSD
jgi:site-specific recombinase XerD